MNSTVEDTFLDVVLEKWKDANNGGDFIGQLDELYQLYPNKNELAQCNFGIKTAIQEMSVNCRTDETPRDKELRSKINDYGFKRYILPNFSSFEKTVREKLTELLRVYKPNELNELPSAGYNGVMRNAMDGDRYRIASDKILQSGLSGVYSTEKVVLSDVKSMIRIILKNMIKDFIRIYDELCVPTYLEEEREFRLQRQNDLQFFKIETSPVAPSLGSISPAVFASV